ncbi:hypothetical protein ALC56_03477, partial [Trachymyrmex septentrionalis]
FVSENITLPSLHFLQKDYATVLLEKTHKQVDIRDTQLCVVLGRKKRYWISCQINENVNTIPRIE